MKKRSKQYMLHIAKEIQQVSALDANSIVYIPKFMANVALPTRSQSSNEFVRMNGDYELTLLSPSSIGLPYGTYPRLIIIWVTTQSKLNKSKDIYLGRSLREFMKNLGKHSSGGLNGSLTALKEQCKRLFSCSINSVYASEPAWSIESLQIAQKATLLWHPKEAGEWEGKLILNHSFFEDVQSSAIPVDGRVITACSHYPLAIDIYCWLTHRYYRLPRKTHIPWNLLACQFANSYGNSQHFKKKFAAALQRVKVFYPSAKFRCFDRGIWLYPSPTHVPKNIQQEDLYFK